MAFNILYRMIFYLHTIQLDSYLGICNRKSQGPEHARIGAVRDKLFSKH